MATYPTVVLRNLIPRIRRSPVPVVYHPVASRDDMEVIAARSHAYHRSCLVVISGLKLAVDVDCALRSRELQTRDMMFYMDGVASIS